MENTEVIVVPKDIAKDSTNPNNRIKAKEETVHGLKRYQEKHELKTSVEVPAPSEERKTQVEPSTIYAAKQAIKNLWGILTVKDYKNEIPVYGYTQIKVSNVEPKKMYAHIQANSKELNNSEDIVVNQMPEVPQENMIATPIDIAPMEEATPVEVTPEIINSVVGTSEVALTAEEKEAIAKEVEEEMEANEKEAEENTVEQESAPLPEPPVVETEEVSVVDEAPNMFSIINNEETAKEEVTNSVEENHDSEVGKALATLREARGRLLASEALRKEKEDAKKQAESELEEAVRNLQNQTATITEQAAIAEQEAEELANEIVEKQALTAEIYRVMNQAEESENSVVR